MTAPHLDELEACLRVHTRVHHRPMPGRTNHIDAAVLVPIVWSAEPTCLLTERPPTMRQHAGEICFPGGRPEPGDIDLCATAMREASEEIGLDDARIIGVLSSVPLLTSDHRIHPFVAVTERGALRPNPGEVRRVVALSIPALLARDHIDAIVWTRDGHTEHAPVFETGGRVLFGATAYVFYELLCVAAPIFGRTAPPLEPGKYEWHDVLAHAEHPT